MPDALAPSERRVVFVVHITSDCVVRQHDVYVTPDDTSPSNVAGCSISVSYTHLTLPTKA